MMTNMKIVFILACGVACIYGQYDIIPPEQPSPKPISTPTPITSIKPTDIPTTTTKSTEIPTTTTKPTTTSTTTTKPTPTTTTTTKPTSTTTKSTPTSKLTTTSKPTSTPKPSPRPTPKPAKLEVGTWYVNRTENSSYTCIILKSSIQIQVDNNTIFVPKNASADGSCDSKLQHITLTWNHPEDTIKFEFENNTSSFDVKSISVNISTETQNYLLIHEKVEFSTNLKKSYKCDNNQTLDLVDTEKSNKTLGHLIVGNFQFQAYQNTSGTFEEAQDCISVTPDVVPIAVGCALVILVIIVLGAYLWGRRRSQARGYLSMFAETKREEDYIPMKNLSCFN